MKIRKLIVERFSKETPKHEISLVAGIIPKPPDPYPNVIFYMEMESIDKDTGKSQKPEPIWLTLGEMVKLSVLMTVASQFWLERLEKDEEYSGERVKEFRKAWRQMSGAVDNLAL
jgi:hypothetical protein